MSEYNGILNNIRKFVKLDKEAESQLISILQTKFIKRRQFLEQPGFTSGYRNYIVKGAFRSFFIDNEGREHTIQIAVEDWFISDFYSYITQTPASLFVEALEDSTIIQMKHDDIEGLCQKIHHLSEYFRITTERAFAFARKRLMTNLSKTAEERFLEYANDYPGMVSRIPQKVIASYLGMSPEFLSKIRSQIARRT